MLSRCAFVLLLAIVALAQQPADPPALRITVTLVQVDAMVTDSKGRHIADLKPEDFEIRQDGKLQKISFFSYIESSPNSTTLPIDKNAPQVPQSFKAIDIKRTVAVVIDDFGLTFENIAQVRQALKKFVDEKLQPGDLLAIIRTGGGISALEQFTTDKRVLYAAIDALRSNLFNNRALQYDDAPMPGVDAGARIDDERGIFDRFSQNATLIRIGEVVHGIQKMPGRKSVTLISANLPIIQNGQIDTNTTAALERLIDLTNRANVSLHTVDPRGLAAFSFRASSRRGMDRFESQEGLSYLAEKTGGMFLRDSNDIGHSLEQVFSDLSGYYLLGYTPSEDTFSKVKSGKNADFRKVSVRVLRPGLQVRTRSGFFGTSDADWTPAPDTRDEQLRAALLSPFGATGVAVRLTSYFRHTQSYGSSVRSLLYLNAKDLTFVEQENGSWRCLVNIATTAYRGVGEEIDTSNRSYSFDLPPEQYERSMKNGLIYSVDHAVKKPGVFLLRAAVRDAVSARTGSASQIIDVPDVRKNRLALSGIVLRFASPEVLEKLKPGLRHRPPLNAEAKPGAEQKPEEYADGNPAVRRFLQGQSLTYAATVINPKMSSKKPPELESTIRLFRNGRQIFISGPRAVPVLSGPKDANHITTAGVLKIGSEMMPGEYVLQVHIRDKQLKKNATATQWMDFEIRPAPEKAKR